MDVVRLESGQDSHFGPLHTTPRYQRNHPSGALQARAARLVVAGAQCLPWATMSGPRGAKDNPTIATIAERLGVSASTVSRVLAGQVSQRGGKSATRHAAIRQLAEELDYRPSFIGQAIRGQRTRIIGVLNPYRRLLTGAVYGTMLSELEFVLRQAGYHAMLECVHAEANLSSSAFLDRRYDGLITFHQQTPAILAAVQRARLPAVAINAVGPLARILPDDRAAMQQLVAHCRERGHRRIAFVPGRFERSEASPASDPGHLEQHYSHAVREDAFRVGCTTAGIAGALIGGFTRNEMIADFLGRPSESRPTALIFYSDVMASRFLAELAVHGVRCPRDLGVCAFGVQAQRQWCTPDLTLALVPIEAMARRAVERLLAALDGAPLAGKRAEQMPGDFVDCGSVPTLTR